MKFPHKLSWILVVVLLTASLAHAGDSFINNNANGSGSSSGAFDTSTTDVTYTNSTTETNLYSVAVPGGTLGSSQCVSQRISGTATWDGSTQVTFRLRYGSGVFTLATTPTALTDVPFVVEAYVCGNGTTSAQRAWFVTLAGFTSTLRSNTGTLSVDSTTSQTLAFSAQYNGATAAISIFKDVAISSMTSAITQNDPSPCGAGSFVTDWSPQGLITCSQPTATQVVNTPAGNIAATTVQGALAELDAEKLSTGGNAATATALAADGTNAASGNAILGTDAAGNAQGAFDVATQTELDSITNGLVADAGAVNDGDNPVHWKQLKGVPAGFADGTDDGAGGGGSQTLDQTFDLGRIIDGAISEAAAVEIGSPTNKIKLWCDDTVNSECTLKFPATSNMVQQLGAGRTAGYEKANGTDILTIKEDTGNVKVEPGATLDAGSAAAIKVPLTGYVKGASTSNATAAATIPITDLSTAGAATGNVPTFNGTIWTLATPSGGGGVDTLQDVMVRGRSVTDAVDVGTGVRLGGTTNYHLFYGNNTDGAVWTMSPAQDLNFKLASAFGMRIKKSTGSDIVVFDEATGNVNIPGLAASSVVTTDSNKKLTTFSLLPSTMLPLPTATTLGGVTSIAAVGSRKIAMIGTDGIPVLADDVQPIISNGPPPVCAEANSVYIDIASTPTALYFCVTQGGNAIDVASLGNAYVTLSDGTNTASAVGAEQMRFAADTGSILSPLVTAGSPDTFKYNFATQTANKFFMSPSSGGAAAPTFRVPVDADFPASLSLASTNTSTSVDNEIALFSSTAGKTLKRATTTGILKGASGVIGAATQDDMSASGYCADAGSTDDYACSLSPAVTAYTTGTRYVFKANTVNTGATTINFNSLGAKTIKKLQGAITTDLASNDIRVGQLVELVYDGTNMQMLSQLGNTPTATAKKTIMLDWESNVLAGSPTSPRCYTTRGYQRLAVACTNSVGDSQMYLAPFAANITDIHCQSTANAGASTTWSWAAYINGSASGTAVATTATNGGSGTFAGSVAVGASDHIGIQNTSTGGNEPTSFAHQCTMVLVEQ